MSSEIEKRIERIEQKVNDILHILTNEFDYYYDIKCAECGDYLYPIVGEGYYCERCDKSIESNDKEALEKHLFKREARVSIKQEKPKLKINGILTQEEAAAAIGIAPNTLSARLKSGEIELPFIELTKGERRFRKADVERYIEKLFEKDL